MLNPSIPDGVRHAFVATVGTEGRSLDRPGGEEGEAWPRDGCIHVVVGGQLEQGVRAVLGSL